jgi:hypothetical protein
MSHDNLELVSEIFRVIRLFDRRSHAGLNRNWMTDDPRLTSQVKGRLPSVIPRSGTTRSELSFQGVYHSRAARARSIGGTCWIPLSGTRDWVCSSDTEQGCQGEV